MIALVASAALAADATADSAADPPAAGEEAANRGGRRGREVPQSMVLCRGPRGAVYARDVSTGCRHVRLGSSNLVDFGAGEECLLRRASIIDPEGETTAIVRDCNDVCEAADDDRTCVVAMRRTDDEWQTFTAAKRFDAGAEELREATVVCCRR